MAVKAAIEAGAQAAGKAAAAAKVAAGKTEAVEAAEATGLNLQVATTAAAAAPPSAPSSSAKATERFALRACRESRPPAGMPNPTHTEGDAQRLHS